MSRSEDPQEDPIASETPAEISLHARDSIVDARDRGALRELLGSGDAAFLRDVRELLAEDGHAVNSMTDADVLHTMEAMLVSGELFLVRAEPT